MSNLIQLSCECGAVTGELAVHPIESFHVECLCCDCQRYAALLNRSETLLDESGATEIFQTYPRYMRIIEGSENVACMQLSESGLYRWYASCCKTPIGNTMRSAKVPFVGVPVVFMKFANQNQKHELLGPLVLRAFGKYAIGPMPSDAHPRFPISFLPRVMFFMLKGLIFNKSVPSPFLTGGKPLAISSVMRTEI